MICCGSTSETRGSGVGIDPRNGRRRQVRRKGFPTKRAAQAELTRVRAAVDTGTHIDRNTMTVAQYLKAWIDSLPATGLRSNTIASYRRTLELYVIDRIGGIRLQALTAIDLDKLYAELLTHGSASAARSAQTPCAMHTC